MAENKEEKKDEKDVSPEDEASKSKKKKLILFVSLGGVLVAGTAGALFFFLASGGSQVSAEKAKEDNTHEGPAETPAGQSEKVSEKKEDAKQESASSKENSSQGKDGEKKEGEAQGEGEKEKKTDKKISDRKLEGVDFGCTMAMGPFHLNLGNPLENRYIRLDIAVEYGCSEDQKEELEKRVPQLKNAVIAVTTRKTREFLLGPDGKEQLRKEILNRINHFMAKKIDDVYITEIIIE